LFGNVPANPVKFKFLYVGVVAVSVKEYVPVVKFMFNAFDSVNPVFKVIVVAVAELLATSIREVPVYVNPVPVILKAVPEATVVISPDVPNAIALVLVLAALNAPQVKLRLFKSIVPFVKVTVLVEPTVRALNKYHPPPTPLKVIGKSNMYPFVDMAFPVVVEANVQAFVPPVRVYLPTAAAICRSPYNVRALFAIVDVPAKPLS
jgi:hypothetical protein